MYRSNLYTYYTKTMKKKIVFSLIGILILLIAAGGFFWWQESGKKLREFEKYRQEMETIYASPKDYVVKETAEGKFIENEKDGLTVKVPQGWRVEKTTELLELEGETVKLLSPDFNSEKGPLKGGCIIKIMVVRNSESLIRDANTVRDFIIESQKNPEKMKNFGYNESYEAIEIANNRQALKKVSLIKSEDGMEIGKYIRVEIPIGDKIYSFETAFIFQNPIDCNQEFNKFLETVSIK